jgi:hypothetical protein
MVKTEPSPSSFSAVVYATNEVANRCEPLSEVWWQGRQWAVTSYGLECRDGTYFIDAPRIGKDLHSANPYILHRGLRRSLAEKESAPRNLFWQEGESHGTASEKASRSYVRVEAGQLRREGEGQDRNPN